MFRGSMVAIIAPFLPDGALDLAAFTRLIDWHLTSGTDAIVVNGTTGEASSLTREEKLELLSTTVKQVAGRVPVIAGTGANSTSQTIANTHTAMEIGVDGVLLMTPAYIKPTQEGLYQHFKQIADAVAIPQILYNVPGRTACDLLPETVGRLADIPNIVSIKEASGESGRVQQIANLTQNKITVLSGEDAIGLVSMSRGAKGVISVTANVAPKLMHEMTVAISRDDKPLASLINNKLQALHEALFIESNPIPVKYALSQLGLCHNVCRLPLTSLSAQHEETVQRALKQAELLQGEFS